MVNLIKYELKGYYKEIVILIAIIIIGNLLIFTRYNVWSHTALATLSFLLCFAASIAVFIWNISIFGRDLYGDTGYLLFTLPIKGYKIVAAKLITSFFQVAIINIIAFIFIYINFLSIQGMSTGLKQLSDSINPVFVICLAVSIIFEYIYLLSLIYFSLSVSKVAIKNRKVGKLGTFIIIIIISTIIGKITAYLSQVFPQFFNINLLSPSGVLSMNFDIANNLIPVNIAAMIFSILMFLVFFIVSSYLIEKKIDI
jgi:ABC-2 type transport system permease protein